MLSQTKSRRGQICTKMKLTDGLPENQGEDRSIHCAYAYNHRKKITFIEFYSSTYRHLHTHARTHARTLARMQTHTHTINIIITATASINIMAEQILMRVKK